MPSRLTFTAAAWQDYVYRETQNRKPLRRVNALLDDGMHHPFSGIGKPEALRENLRGFWSRRIDDTHRLVYAVKDQDLVVIACRYHYE